MNLYLLERPFKTVGYDENRALVVRAETERDARAVASGVASGEGKVVWLDGTAVVTLLATRVSGERGTVLISFRAG
jgi:hypothetical protein